MNNYIGNINYCETIEIYKIQNPFGNISIIENDKNLPFRVRRVYYLYDIPGGAERGGHAHKELYQLIVAVSGSFDVVLDDGQNRKVVLLNNPNKGLIIVPWIWRELINFSSGAICLVLASEKYSELDYLREYSDFILFRNG
jgi:hypothetical protein